MDIQYYISEGDTPVRQATSGAAGFDLPTLSYSLVTNTLRTGTHFEIPEGHVGFLLPRSSSGIGLGLELKNTVGVIDSDYRGEIKAVIRPVLSQPFKKGDYNLQLVVVPVPSLTLQQVPSLDLLSSTARGKGGFGSTGGN
tara:strand:+ start:6238 stop:6657 length:420 start_codon:yes stop_codon:yes gene_type:complete